MWQEFSQDSSVITPQRGKGTEKEKKKKGTRVHLVCVCDMVKHMGTSKENKLVARTFEGPCVHLKPSNGPKITVPQNS